MCQAAVRRPYNTSKSSHVRKVARLLAQALSAFGFEEAAAQRHGRDGTQRVPDVLEGLLESRQE